MIGRRLRLLLLVVAVAGLTAVIPSLVLAVAAGSFGSPPGAGTLFGLAVVPGGQGVYFVDNGSNTLNLLS